MVTADSGTLSRHRLCPGGQKGLPTALTIHSDIEVPGLLLLRTGEVAGEDGVLGDIGDEEPAPLRVLFQQNLVQGCLQSTGVWIGTAGATVDFQRPCDLNRQPLWPHVYLKHHLTRSWKTRSMGSAVCHQQSGSGARDPRGRTIAGPFVPVPVSA